MNVYGLILGSLAVWRVTHLLRAEDGPWDVIVRLRRLAGDGMAGRLMDCFYCLSLWVAVPAAWAVGATWRERLLLWPALSAGAILVERWIQPQTGPAPAGPAEVHYAEDPEPPERLLRPTPIDGPADGGGRPE